MEIKCADCDGTGRYIYNVRNVSIDQETKETINPRNPGFPINMKCDNCNGEGMLEYINPIVSSENLVDINCIDNNNNIRNVIYFNLFPNKTEINVTEGTDIELSVILNKDEFKQLIDELTNLWNKMI